MDALSGSAVRYYQYHDSIDTIFGIAWVSLVSGIFNLVHVTKETCVKMASNQAYMLRCM